MGDVRHQPGWEAGHAFCGSDHQHSSPQVPSLPPSQLLKAVVEVTDTSVKAVQMAKQQQGKQICWGSNNSVMSLGMWSPLSVAVATRLVVRGRAFVVHLGLAPAAFCA